MLHQPMEPYNSSLDPGPGALYVGYGTRRISRIVEENFSSVPFAIGVNNHMGSRLTSSRKEMNDVLRVIKKRSLFFVDSLTSSRSMAYRTAQRLHITSACRNIFLDNRPDESAILTQLHKLKRHALKYKCAIGIGHPFPETARAIGRFQRGLKDSSVSLVHVSRILHS
ncbi:MAG: divergent polysaccharide deacetylase family protein [Deltaproteobacteria bacterium]|nr:divergent polysaccharide deacetylase family protein [Deltaproteobacteria bacterium]